MTNSDLANLSDQLMLGTALLYVVAMIGYAIDLAFGQRRADAPAGRAAAEQPVMAGARAGSPAGGAGSGAGGVEPEEESGRRSIEWGRFAVLLTVLGWGAHLGMIVTRGLAAERWPWGNMFEFLTALTFAVVTAYLVVLWRHGVRYLGAFAMVLAVIGMGVSVIWLHTPAGPVVPALQSYWIAIHVSAAIVASGSLALSGVTTVLYLLKSRRAAVVDGPGLLARLPGAPVLDGLAYRLVLFAFPIWTFAIIAGAIWADEAWGRYWGWDPKEVWSFVTWVVYAGYLHARATAGWRGRKAAVVSLIAFAALLFNFFGVNYMFSGMHSYA